MPAASPTPVTYLTQAHRDCLLPRTPGPLHTSSVSTTPPDHPEPAAPLPATRVDVAALYQQHHRRLRKHARQRLPNHLDHEADTALMTVFTKLLDMTIDGRLTEPDNWEAYLVRAVTNACHDIVKSTSKNDEEIDEDDPRIHRDTPTDPTGDTAADRADRAGRTRLAKAALDTLEPRLRTIAFGILGHERSNRDLGIELGLTGQRVGQLCKTALQQLRDEVNPTDD
jgi:RNA polymerase sigma factor (sigma-70 family)